VWDSPLLNYFKPYHRFLLGAVQFWVNNDYFNDGKARYIFRKVRSKRTKPRSEPSTTLADRQHERRCGDEKTVLATGEGHEYITGIKLAVVIISVTMAAILYMLDISIIATVSLPRAHWRIRHNANSIGCLFWAIPYITSDFHSLPDVGWYGSAYFLGKYVGSIPSNFLRNALDRHVRLAARCSR
jgi:hypothetical protein